MSLVKLLVISGCIFSALAKPPPYAKEAQDLMKVFAGEMTLEKKYISLGSGGFYTDKKIDSFYIDFEVEGSLNEKEAEIALKSAVETLVCLVNTRESVRPFLSTYPITEAQVSVSLAFVDKKRAPVQGLSQIHFDAGRVIYSSYNAQKKRYEPFIGAGQEAAQKVN